MDSLQQIEEMGNAIPLHSSMCDIRSYYVFVVCGDTAVLLLLLLLLLLAESFYWGVVKIRYTHQSTVFFL